MPVAEVFGQYRVLDVLGHGAMGMVYRARDPRLDRLVALKIVHPGRVAKDADKARARLVSEARALARVAHPNALAVYDVGVHDGLVFVALELVEGVDLAQWLCARSRSWEDIVRVFIEAAQGLAAVHAADLVHRDVKPANILVERAPRGREFGRVLVADFGIARATADAPLVTLPDEIVVSRSDEDAPLTEEGRVVGTPAYMAPEQHLGLEVGPAADQYALCVALYEALYGRRPFGGDPQTMLRAKSKPRDEPPDSDVPRWLWTTVRRGLSPRPHDRFPTVTDLIAALRAGPPPRKWLAPVGATIAVVIAGAAIVSQLVPDQPCRGLPVQVTEAWNEARRTELERAFDASNRPYAARTWTRVSERLDAYAHDLGAMYIDACEATRVRHEQSEAIFDRRIACLDKRRQRLAQSLAVLLDSDADVADHAEGVVGSLEPVAACGDIEALEAGVEPPDAAVRDEVAEVRRATAEADALLLSGRADEAAATAHAAVETARKVDYAPAVVEALAVLGECLERQSKIPEAREALEEAASLGARIGYDEIVARAAISRTWMAGQYEHDEEAIETWSALGRSRLERIGNPPHLSLKLHNALGSAYSALGRSEESLREYEQAVAWGEKDPKLARAMGVVHSNIGNEWRRRGELARARDSYERAREILRDQFGDAHPLVANMEVRVAQIMDLAGEYNEAVAAHRRAIAALERVQAPPTELGMANVSLGIALRNVGAHEDSNASFRRAIELLTDTGDHLTLAHAHVAFGLSCLDQGIYDAAETQFQRAVELLEPIDATHRDLVSAWIGLGFIREQQARPDEAISLYRRAYDAGTAAGPTRAGANAQREIALLHQEAGRYDEALAALDLHDEVLAASPVILPDDHLGAATARVKVMVAAGRAAEATAEIDALERLLAEARTRSGAPSLARGELVLGRARLARGENEAACAALGRAIDEFEAEKSPDLVEQAREALEQCTRARSR